MAIDIREFEDNEDASRGSRVNKAPQAKNSTPRRRATTAKRGSTKVGGIHQRRPKRMSW
jgi:hypothetical protein